MKDYATKFKELQALLEELPSANQGIREQIGKLETAAMRNEFLKILNKMPVSRSSPTHYLVGRTQKPTTSNGGNVKLSKEILKEKVSIGGKFRIFFNMFLSFLGSGGWWYFCCVA